MSGLGNLWGPDAKGLSPSPAEVYTIQGNSHGKPCTIPFKYDNQWFHGCTSTGREDGHLWCATTQDYGKDERWGFCPIKGEGQWAGWREVGPGVGSAAGVGGTTFQTQVRSAPTPRFRRVSAYSLRDLPLDPAERAGAGPTPDCPGGR